MTKYALLILMFFIVDNRKIDPKWNIHDAEDVAGYIYLKGTVDGNYNDCDYVFQGGISTIGDIGMSGGRVTATCKDSWEMKKYDKTDPPTYIRHVTRVTRYRWSLWGGAKSGVSIESVGTDAFGNPCEDEWSTDNCEARGRKKY
jgi:hypothetical protein